MKDLSEEGQKIDKNHYKSQKFKILLYSLNYKFITGKMSSENLGNFLSN